MKILKLLSQLRSLNIKVWLEGDRLRVKAPNGVMTPDLKKELADNKEELLLFLRESQQGAETEAHDATALSGSSFSALSAEQQNIWLVSKFATDPSITYFVLSYRVLGALNHEALQHALNRLALRHEILRTRFPIAAGIPVPTLVEKPAIPLRKLNLRMMPEKQRETELLERMKEHVAQSFDLDQGPLFRCSVFWMEEQDYRILLVFHGLVADQSSTAILLNDLGSFYSDYIANKTMEAVIPAKPYSDFVQKQNEWVASEACKTEQQAWRSHLSDHTFSHELVLESQARNELDFHVTKVSISLGRDKLASIQGLLDQAQVSNSVFFQTLFSTYLFKYTGRDRFLFCASEERSRQQPFGETCGLFSQKTLIKADLQQNESFRRHLEKFADQQNDAAAFQNLSLMKLIEVVRVDADLSRPSTIKVFLAMQEQEEVHEFAGLQWQPFPSPLERSCFDVSLKVITAASEIQLQFAFNTAMFDPIRIQSLTSYFENLLGQALAAPDCNLSDLSFLTENETNHFTLNWNQTEKEFSGTKLLHGLFEERVKQNPHVKALQVGDQSWTYAELEENACAMACYFSKEGLDHSCKVGIYLEHSMELCCVILAVLKTGASIVLLEVGNPKDRLAAIIRDAPLSFLITKTTLSNNLIDKNPKTIFLDEMPQILPKEPLFVATIDPISPAFIHYTAVRSGSPKGVILSHHALSLKVKWMRETFPLELGAKTLLKTSLSFDGFVTEFFWPISSGGTLVIAKSEPSQNGKSLAAILNQHFVGSAYFTPNELDDLVSSIAIGECKSLTNVFCGGELLTAKLREKFFSKLPKATLFCCYGPSESGTLATVHTCRRDDASFVTPIGKPIANTKVYLLDQQGRPVPCGVHGEIYIGGSGLASGYLNHPELNAAHFLPDPFSGGTMYRTGDLARYDEDGMIDYLGRLDHQFKIQGVRIEPAEIEAELLKLEDIQEALVVMRVDASGKSQLIAYYTCDGDPRSSEQLRGELAAFFPSYMIPSYFVPLSSFPLNEDGTFDRHALPIPKELLRDRPNEYPRAFSEIERLMAQIWRDVLKIEKVDIHDNFFDIGGSSYTLAQVYDRLPEMLKKNVKPIDLFRFPTIRALDLFLENQQEEGLFYLQREDYQREIREICSVIRNKPGLNVAVIGMACRYPGSETIDQFWQNLREGVESITFFSAEELQAEGVAAELLQDPDYIRAKGILPSIKHFDAGFFEFTPREAQITEPQHRIFLELAWEAMENAGYAPGKNKHTVGVFGGSGNNHYQEKNLNPNAKLLKTVGELPILIGNDKDNLCSRISFKLNLTGPSLTIQSACSTSLVAIYLASQAILRGECGMALAGGIAFRALEKEGYLYEEGLLMPPDGHTRSFDTRAQGSVPSQGAGIVLLKRLEDALIDGDHIYAVIKGGAITNDGSGKVGYTAYGVDGQKRAILAAQASAGILPEDMSYVETSSTASPMGDPIEVEALTKAFQTQTRTTNFCALGAIKPNIGATDIAAGAAAFIKASLAVKNKEIPPNINFETPNPKIEFEKSPFFVHTELLKWKPADKPRYVGISGFGLGGTNAHLILSEAPEVKPSPKARPWQLMLLSAKTPSALEASTERLVKHMRVNPDQNFSDVAFTLQVGRQDFKYRRMLVCQNAHEAIIELEKRNPRRVYTAMCESHSRPIAFMFPGQGSQYTNMGQQLYQVDLNYREQVDECWEIVRKQFPELYQGLSEQDRHSRTEKLHQSYITQLSLFIVEYSLAKMLIHWGCKPQAMIGNSTGEYVAACLAGIFSLEDAIQVIVGRGRLMHELPPGDMAAIGLSERDLTPYLNEHLSIAGVAAPQLCMVSGTKAAVAELRALLSSKGIVSKPLFAPKAFHSYMVDSIVPRFAEMVAKVKLNPPQIPIVSTITGTWISDEEATDPNYWARQQRQTVRFSQGVDLLLQETDRVLLEVGPDKTLSSLAMQSQAKTMKHLILATMRQPHEDESDLHHLLTSLGRLWMSGLNVDWPSYHSVKRRLRVPLPTYPFERERHWIDAIKVKDPDKNKLELEADTLKPTPTPQAQFYRPNVPTGYVAPQDNVEAIIAGFWQEFLGLEQIGIHDDFFELGGSSLIAVRLINQMSKKFGVPLASHILLQKRTIGTLAETIRANLTNPKAAEAADTPLVEIQAGLSSIPALYMAHPIGGEIYFYRDMAQYLGPNQPVYGFQAPSLIGKREAFSDLKEQAAFYVEALQKHQPKGPYILGGSSYGGNVAYEMAQQLFAKGENVPLLVVVDSPAPGQMPSKFTDTAAILEYLLGDKLELDLDMLRDMGPEDQMAYVFELARNANQVDVLPPSLGVPLFKTWMGHQTAMHNYQPQPYPGRVIFFRPTERMKVNPPNMHLPWIEMVKGGIEIHQVGGNHISMNFEENAKMIAKHLQRAFNSL